MRSFRRFRVVVWMVLSCAILGLGGCGGGGDGGEGGGPTPPEPPLAAWTREGIVWSEPYAATAAAWQNVLEYKKVGDTVHLRGTVDAGPTRVRGGQVIGTLPEGFRPPTGASVVLLAPTWGWPASHPEGYVGAAGVCISSDGSVVIQSVKQYDGEQQFLYFDGLSFSTTSHTGGWTNAEIAWSAPYATMQGLQDPWVLEFRKSGTTVELRGLVDAGPSGVQAGQEVFTLPEGYRPPTPEVVLLLCPTWAGWAAPSGAHVGTAVVLIDPDGRVQVLTLHQDIGGQRYLVFDGLSFSTVSGTDGWTNAGMAWNPPYGLGSSYPSSLAYRETDDRVSLRGVANAGTTWVRSGQVVATLPEGCRPPSTVPRVLLCPTRGDTAGFPYPGGYNGTAGVAVLNGDIVVMSVHQYDGELQFLAFDARGFSAGE